MTRASILLLIIMAIVPGCDIFLDNGPWDLELGLGVAGQQVEGDISVLFPNESSLENSSFIRIYALDPEGLRCEDLISGDIKVDDLEKIRSLAVKLPLPEGTALRKICIWLFPLSIAAIPSTISAKVTVLTPPPVDPGEAPINIRNIRNNFDLGAKLAMFIVLKPAVRAVTDWK